MNTQLSTILADSWSKLKETDSRNSGFQYMTVCNYAPDGINAYTVVLREVNTDDFRLIFYTDFRSPKVKQMEINSKVSLVLYNDEEKLQLTMQGEAAICRHNETANACWKKNGYKGRTSYLAQPAPSTVVNEPINGLAHLHGREFNEPDNAGFENFAVVIVKIYSLEYLQLNKSGNLRAAFKLQHNVWEGSWLIP